MLNVPEMYERASRDFVHPTDEKIERMDGAIMVVSRPGKVSVMYSDADYTPREVIVLFDIEANIPFHIVGDQDHRALFSAGFIEEKVRIPSSEYLRN